MRFEQLSQKNQERIRVMRDIARGKIPEMCLERPLLFTESYKQTEGKPYAIRKGLAMKNIMEKRTVTIFPGDLIVGTVTSKQCGTSFSMDVNSTWLVADLENMATRDAGGKALITDEQKQQIKEIAEYWEGQCLASRWLATVPQDVLDLHNIIINGAAHSINNQNYGHYALDYETIFKKGVKGIIADVEAAQAALTDLGDDKQFDAWCEHEGMLISLRALSTLANRYADEAARLAGEEADSERKAELEKISAVCRHVATEPPRTVWECLQLLTFIRVGINSQTYYPHCESVGRIDKWMYPYYKNDLATGELTEETAFLLYAAFMCKSACYVLIAPGVTGASFQGARTGGNGIQATIGGVDENGDCVVNEISYLILDVDRALNLANDLMVRISDNTPLEFIEYSVELARDLCGKIKYIGDKATIRMMTDAGRPLELSRNFVVTGCTSPSIPSWSLEPPGGIINISLMLDLALHDGYSVMLKKQLGPHTGDARTFTTYEQLWNAWGEQYRYFLPKMHMMKTVDKVLNAKYNPSPLHSAFCPLCVERGVDFQAGGTAPYVSFAMGVGGAPNVGDSLAAVKKLVFDEGRYTMAQIIDALDKNFEGEDAILHALEHAPKFGNDIDYVDNIVADVISFCCDEAVKTPGPLGGANVISGSSVTANLPQGKLVGALPDGRKAGEPLSEGGLSPYQGRNTSGITATFNSLVKIPHEKMRHSEVFNLRIDPTTIKTPEKIKLLAQMILLYEMRGGPLVQFNIVSTDTLRAAQADPDAYRDLLVRVATYSAFFVGLTKETQDDIINRLAVQL